MEINVYFSKIKVIKNTIHINDSKTLAHIMDISWNDFEKIEMHIGTILTADDFPQARKPAYQLTIDFGTEIGILKSSAQLTKRYSKDDLIAKQIVAVVNFPKKQIGNFMSECLVLGAVGEDGDVILLQPDFKIANGLKIG